MLLWEEYYIRHNIPIIKDEPEIVEFGYHIAVRDDMLYENRAWICFAGMFVPQDVDFNALLEQRRAFNEIPHLQSTWNYWLNSGVFDHFQRR